MGEPEDLSGCSRTVFGVKILCGLISPINPQSSQEDRGFFIVIFCHEFSRIKDKTDFFATDGQMHAPPVNTEKNRDDSEETGLICVHLRDLWIKE
jgi:hypothetical protein